VKDLSYREVGTSTRGAPTKRTLAAVEVLRACLKRGVPRGMACRMAGITYPTFLAWQREDERFREEVELAIAAGVDGHLGNIEAASKTDWRASCWILERCHPDQFGRNRVELTGADGAPLAAGVQLYLPKKDDAGAPGARALPPEGGGNGDH